MSFLAGTAHSLYTQSTVKAGDTLSAATNGTTFTNFASSVVVPANSASVGIVYRVDFMGLYTTSAVPPSTTAKVSFGSVPVVSTAALTNPVSGTNLGYAGFVNIVVLNAGSSGSVRGGGILFFDATGGNTLTVLVPTTTTTGIDFTVNQTLQLGAAFGAGTAGNTNTLQSLIITEIRPVKASS